MQRPLLLLVVVAVATLAGLPATAAMGPLLVWGLLGVARCLEVVVVVVAAASRPLVWTWGHSWRHYSRRPASARTK